MPTGYNVKAMVVELFLHNILLLEVYSFEGFLKWHKNDEMVNNLKNTLILLNIVSNIASDLSRTYQLNY